MVRNRYEVQIWAYCLMPNHVHLIAFLHRQRLRRIVSSPAIYDGDQPR